MPVHSLETLKEAEAFDLEQATQHLIKAQWSRTCWLAMSASPVKVTDLRQLDFSYLGIEASLIHDIFVLYLEVAKVNSSESDEREFEKYAERVIGKELEAAHLRLEFSRAHPLPTWRFYLVPRS